MELKMEIICDNFKQIKIENNKIQTNDPTEEYYIIPLNKPYTLESDEEIFKLTFTNQLLYLKYSNHKKTIQFNEYNYKECIIIKSNEIHEIYLEIKTDNYQRKNVWHTHYTKYMNKQYLNQHFLVIPIIENIIQIKKTTKNYQIKLITNEILLKPVRPSKNKHGHIELNNNILLNQEALFIQIPENELNLFLEKKYE